MKSRLFAWLMRLVIALDQTLGVMFRGPVYLAGLGTLPSADQTISAFVGVNANKGKPWAIEAQRVIDALFGAGHCQRAILDDGKD